MTLTTQPAIEIPLSELCNLLNRGFSDYIVPMELSVEALAFLVRTEAIDLKASEILLNAGVQVGTALIARRGSNCRLAAMSLVPEGRGKGSGRWFLEELLNKAKARKEDRMYLEVFEQNEPAKKLYQSAGFETIDRLFEFRIGKLDGESSAELEEAEMRDLVTQVLAFGEDELPWQASGESAAQFCLPSRAYRLGPAWICITDPLQPEIRIRSIIVEPDAREQGHGSRLILALAAQFPGKTWSVPMLYRSSLGTGIFEKLGFEKSKLNQLFMKKSL